MRILTELQRWTMRNWFANLVGGERRYEVSGAIAFETTYHDVRSDLDRLRNAILEIDAEFPWRDDIHPDAGERKSIHYLGGGNVVIHNFAVPIMLVWFSVHPKWEMLRKSQIYAYEHYLAKLAEELAKRFAESSLFSEVRSVIEVRAVSSFKTAAQ